MYLHYIVVYDLFNRLAFFEKKMIFFDVILLLENAVFCAILRVWQVLREVKQYLRGNND
jgi:hypothetical protein